MESWRLLCFLHSQSSLPWLCMGDFNEVLSQEEKFGRLEHRSKLIEYFREVLLDCGLMNLGFQGFQYTWSNKRKLEPVYTRLDLFVVNAQWCSLFPNCVVSHLNEGTSDHLPVLLTKRRKQTLRKKSHIVLFEPIWLKQEECVSIFSTSWDSMRRNLSLYKRICKVRSELFVWGEHKFGRLQFQIKKAQEMLQSIRRKQPFDASREIEISKR